MDTLERRWARLAPHTIEVGPDDDAPRPAVLIFHGCGGLRAHLPRYAEAARASGRRAFIVDSHAARGFGRAVALATVCTGLRLRGAERAGDVLAAVEGVARRPDVDGARLILGGWSHGGWSIMEALSAEPAPGALGVADPASCDLSRVRGVWLSYPYIGPLAANRMRPWRCRPRTAWVTARRDHLTSVANARRVEAMLRGSGVPVDDWTPDAAHAFDEPGGVGPGAYDPALAEDAVDRFAAFLAEADDA